MQISRASFTIYIYIYIYIYFLWDGPYSPWDPLNPYGPRQLLARAHAGVKCRARSGKMRGDLRTERQLCHIYIYIYMRESEREREREWTANDL